MNAYLKKAQHPAISWVVIIAALGLGGTSLRAVNSLENLTYATSLELRHEKELRISEQSGIKEDLNELKQGAKDLAQDFKDDTNEIKSLLQQLLLQQAGAVRPLPRPN